MTHLHAHTATSAPSVNEMRRFARATAFLGCYLAAACGSSRSEVEKGEVCNGTQPAAQFLALDSPARLAMTTAAGRPNLLPSAPLYVAGENAEFMSDIAAMVRRKAAPAPPQPIHVLAISAGGQWGAYGAGVVGGWRRNPSSPAPEFDIVTGISTGAMLAPLVFLKEDEKAKELYTNLSNADVYRERSYLELITANSLVDTAPLHDKVRGVIDDDFVKRIAAEGARGRILAVQAVNLDRGESIVFNLTAIAQGLRSPCGNIGSARDCMINAILAAAAIPVAFPPVFINGDMYVDGGLRQHAFTIDLIGAVARRPATAARLLDQFPAVRGGIFSLPQGGAPEAGALPVDLTLIANSNFQYKVTCTDNGFIKIAERSATIATDQLSIGGFFRLLSETLSEAGNMAKYTFADPDLTPECKYLPTKQNQGVTDNFDKKYMRCLYKSGCALAYSGGPIWRTNPSDLPQSPITREDITALRERAVAIPEFCAVGDEN